MKDSLKINTVVGHSQEIKGWSKEEAAETNLRPRRLCDGFLQLSQRINSTTSAVTVVLGREKIK